MVYLFLTDQTGMPGEIIGTVIRFIDKHWLANFCRRITYKIDNCIALKFALVTFIST